MISIRHHKGVSHDQIPIATTFENADLHNASSGCNTTKIQLFCPNVLHNVANALGHKTNITNDCYSAKWLPAPSHTCVIPPNFYQISILASDLYHAIHDCYCCLPFSKQNAHFSYQPVPMGMIISVKVGWKGGKGGVGTAEVVEVEQLRQLSVVMVGRVQVGVMEFYFYIHVFICIDNMHQCR